LIGSGNTFVELQAVREICSPEVARRWGIRAGQLVLMIHSGAGGAAPLNLYFTPRWGLHGDAFLPFEREKWRFHADHLNDKATMSAKHQYFCPGQRVFTIPAGTPDAELYLTCTAALSNLSVANRMWLGWIFDQVRGDLGLLGSPRRLLWDSLHDSIQWTATPGGEPMFVHRHGAAAALPAGQWDDSHPFAQTGQPVVVPSCPGGESLLAACGPGVERSWYSVNHGTGRRLDRPQARERYSDALATAAVSRAGCRLYNRAERFGGEHPDAFRALEPVLAAAQAAGLYTPVARTRAVAVLKG
jgi:tRNA-splicing ligase RtcB